MELVCSCDIVQMAILLKLGFPSSWLADMTFLNCALILLPAKTFSHLLQMNEECGLICCPKMTIQLPYMLQIVVILLVVTNYVFYV